MTLKRRRIIGCTATAAAVLTSQRCCTTASLMPEQENGFQWPATTPKRRLLHARRAHTSAQHDPLAASIHEKKLSELEKMVLDLIARRKTCEEEATTRRAVPVEKFKLNPMDSDFSRSDTVTAQAKKEDRP